MKRSRYAGVAGVLRVDSGVSGPVLGITVCTHGNELCGLEALSNVLKILKRKVLLKGSIMMVVNNLKAAEKALNAKNLKDSLDARYIDVNMNRLPENLLKLTKDKRYEIRRALELIPVWKKFDYAIDIHSMTQNSQPILIVTKNLSQETIEGFLMRTIIKNIENVQIGKPAFAFYGRNSRVEVVEIEAGQHDDPKSVNIAMQSILAMLKNLKMIPDDTSRKTNSEKKEYVVVSSVMAEKSMVMSRRFRNFERVKKGEILARTPEREIRSPLAGHIVMVPRGKKIIKIGEEAFFLSKPVKRQ